MKIAKAGIIGASGYSGEVLVELLAKHPEVGELVVASRSKAGQRVDSEMPRLRGLVDDLVFVSSDIEQLTEMDVPVWFLALPHGVAAEFALPLVASGALVIDLSADFRLNSPTVYETYYGATHPAPDWLAKTPYVLPELTESGWESSKLIACPGCYPTSILVPLLPLIRERLVGTDGIVINSVSGVSGAGKKASEMYSYCERTQSVLAYGLGKHRHLSEIEEQLSLAAGKNVMVQFTPHLVPMTRGIASTIIVPTSASSEDVYAVWEKVFKGRKSVQILPSGKAAETGHVVGKNRIDISATKDERTGNLIITSAEDNLLKGAGGQAVQIMNLVFGLSEQCGLLD